ELVKQCRLRFLLGSHHRQSSQSIRELNQQIMPRSSISFSTKSAPCRPSLLAKRMTALGWQQPPRHDVANDCFEPTLTNAALSTNDGFDQGQKTSRFIAWAYVNKIAMCFVCQRSSDIPLINPIQE
ncbi:hypothetical protein, partial [Falsiruegeria mediterranea]|uniref:hypothetical protein n=1 Tax=Falsiruegeria mediterranea TaxID=1280832 RepID=UPI001A9CA626